MSGPHSCPEGGDSCLRPVESFVSDGGRGTCMAVVLSAGSGLKLGRQEDALAAVGR